jgi:hypothetical protein
MCCAGYLLTADEFPISIPDLLGSKRFSPFPDIPLQIGEGQAQSQTSENRESNIQWPRALAPHF